MFLLQRQSLHLVSVILIYFCMTMTQTVTARLDGRMSMNDLSINQFTENGEIAQLEYASKAVKRDTPSLAFIHKKERKRKEQQTIEEADGDEDEDAICCILSISSKVSPLLLNSASKIEYHRGQNLVNVVNGYWADCDYVRKHLYEVVANSMFQYGESPSLDYLGNKLSTWIVRGMYKIKKDTIARPLAVNVLLSKFDQIRNKPRLLQIQNSGIVSDCEYVFVGSISAQTKSEIRRFILDVVDGGIVEKIRGVCQFLEEELLGNENQGDIIVTDSEPILECCIVSRKGIKKESCGLSKYPSMLQNLFPI